MGDNTVSVCWLLAAAGTVWAHPLVVAIRTPRQKTNVRRDKRDAAEPMLADVGVGDKRGNDFIRCGYHG